MGQAAEYQQVTHTLNQILAEITGAFPERFVSTKPLSSWFVSHDSVPLLPCCVAKPNQGSNAACRLSSRRRRRVRPSMCCSRPVSLCYPSRGKPAAVVEAKRRRRAHGDPAAKVTPASPGHKPTSSCGCHCTSLARWRQRRPGVFNCLTALSQHRGALALQTPARQWSRWCWCWCCCHSSGRTQRDVWYCCSSARA